MNHCRNYNRAVTDELNKTVPFQLQMEKANYSSKRTIAGKKG
jgi:hypothetical protein